MASSCLVSAPDKTMMSPRIYLSRVPPSYPSTGLTITDGNSPTVSAMDTVGESPQAADHPESGQDGGSGEEKSRFPDGPDEFANSISRFISHRSGGLLVTVVTHRLSPC